MKDEIIEELKTLRDLKGSEEVEKFFGKSLLYMYRKGAQEERERIIKILNNRIDYNKVLGGHIANAHVWLLTSIVEDLEKGGKK
jgi:hypothetical protein